MNISRSLARFAQQLWEPRSVARFCVLFCVYSLLAFSAIYALQDAVVEPFTRAIAWIAYKVMRAFGSEAWIHGVAVGVSTFGVQIRNNCNAIYEMGLYSAAVLAYPASARSRTMGILFGVVVLYVVNLIRVLSLIYIGYLMPGSFEAAHVYVWQVLFLVVVGALWFSWIGRVRRVA